MSLRELGYIILISTLISGAMSGIVFSVVQYPQSKVVDVNCNDNACCIELSRGGYICNSPDIIKQNFHIGQCIQDPGDSKPNRSVVCSERTLSVLDYHLGERY